MNDTGKKTEKKVSVRTLLILSAVILLVACFSLSDYVFGDRIMAFNQDIGSDSLHLYAAQYASVIRHLKEGTLTFWDASNAFGADVNIYSLGNPFLWIVYLTGVFFGTQAWLRSLVFVYILQILLAGILCYLYLSLFRLGEIPKAAAAFMYAFSGYMMVWGQHYAFASYPVFLVLLVLCAERCVQDGKWKLLPFASFLVTCNSVYGAYMIFLFTGGYVILRAVMLLSRGNAKTVLRRTVSSVLCMFLGIAMGAALLIPGALQITQTTKRLSYDSTALERVFGARFPEGYVKVLVWRLFSPSVQGINYAEYPMGNYYEAPVLYFSLPALFLIPQYLWCAAKRKTSVKNRVMHYLAAGFMAYGLLLPHVSVVMNGFAYAFTRYQFVYGLYFAVCAAVALDMILREGRGSAVLAALTGAASAGILIRLYLSRRAATGAVFGPLFAVTAGTAFCLILMLLPKTRGRRWPVVFLLILLVGNIALEMDFTYDNGGEGRTAYLTRDTLREDDGLVASLEDPDTMAAIDRIRSYDDLFSRTEKLSYVLMGTDPLVQGYTGVSGYNSMRSSDIDRYMLRHWKDLWKWHTAHFYYPHGASHRDQAQLCGIRYLLAGENDTVPEGYVLRETVGKIRIFEDQEVTSAVSFYTDHTGDDFAYAKRDRSAEAVIRRGKNESSLTAFVKTEKEGILFLAVGYQNGWKIRLDGKQVEPQKVMDGFTGVEVPAGTHTITLRYVSPGALEGAMISAAGIMLYLAALFAGRKRRKHADHTV